MDKLKNIIEHNKKELIKKCIKEATTKEELEKCKHIK